MGVTVLGYSPTAISSYFGSSIFPLPPLPVDDS
jgi:hypothetical protein